MSPTTKLLLPLNPSQTATEKGRGVPVSAMAVVFLDCTRRPPIGRFGLLGHPTSLHESPPGSALPHCWEYRSSERISWRKKCVQRVVREGERGERARQSSLLRAEGPSLLVAAK